MRPRCECERECKRGISIDELKRITMLGARDGKNVYTHRRTNEMHTNENMYVGVCV